ncbi:MAG: cysteine--tRNA ligase [Candidatus Aureabacteria bacterium]|nr:cysteine--tRNA ligase [Candidatus Auribacterota bacterium]
MKIFLYNTLSRKKEEFAPIKKGNVGIYTCGPTVYNYAHIGNLRTYLFEDILKRIFIFNGYKPKHVMNVTDVGHLVSDSDEGEDKMVVGARREKKTVWEIARFYEDAFFSDTDKLNIMKPDVICRATEHIQEMKNLISKIEKNGFTYESEGNIYFEIDKFQDYGKLARRNIAGLKAGSRIEVDKHKKNPHDFVLWFTKSKHGNQDMQWDSPWGRGFPGWHVECSAMSMKYLGGSIDIHCGGIDHISVHHTNEIAQSEAATGKKWVNYWLHGEFLVVDKERMAKSAGEFLTLEKLIDAGFSPLDYRYFCLGAHYSSQLVFSYEALESARNGFKNMKDRILKLRKMSSSEVFSGSVEHYASEFIKQINDDLNVPKAFALAWDLIKDDNILPSDRLTLLYDFDSVFGLGLKDLKEEIMGVPDEVMALVRDREIARKEKNWKEADLLREKIQKAGFVVKDTCVGTEIKKVV